LVLAALDSAWEAAVSREWETPNVVSTVPATASTKASVWVRAFKKKFYVDPKIQKVPFAAHKPTSVEASWLRRDYGAKSVPVPSEDLLYVESVARASLCSLGTVDWLFGTLKHMLDEEEQDPIMFQQTWSAATRALRHATQFSASAVTAAVLHRRKAFLASTQAHKVPEKCKNWLLFQPLPDNSSPSLFGDVVPTLETVARDESQSQVMNLAAKVASGGRGSRGAIRRAPFRARQWAGSHLSRRQEGQSDVLKKPFRGKGPLRGRGRYRK
jgi:hypothetical protein